MKIYLDNCALQRPLDDCSQFRIRLESEAIIEIVEIIEAGLVSLLSSDVLIYEIKKCNKPERIDLGFQILSLASDSVSLTKEIAGYAKELEVHGLGGIDALHLAAAEAGEADYLCTCDDIFLKRTAALSGLNTKVISPVNFIEEYDSNESRNT